jgi:hypothetical protein
MVVLMDAMDLFGPSIVHLSTGIVYELSEDHEICKNSVINGTKKLI